MDIEAIVSSVKEGENVLILYPDNDVFLAMSKLIAEKFTREKIGWFVFNELGKKRLEKFFRIFSVIAPKDVGKVFTSYDDIDREIIISYGYHFQSLMGVHSTETLIRLVLDDNIKTFNFIYRDMLEMKEIIALKDLFDYVIDVREKEAPLGKEFFYTAKAYVYPSLDVSGAIKITERYDIYS